jgi:hypothetical protein
MDAMAGQPAPEAPAGAMFVVGVEVAATVTRVDGTTDDDGSDGKGEG